MCKMKAILSALSLMLGTVMPLVAHAGDLRPLEAGTVVLGTHTVSVYYTVSGDTYEVVTTIAPGPEAPARRSGSSGICYRARKRSSRLDSSKRRSPRRPWSSCTTAGCFWPSG